MPWEVENEELQPLSLPDSAVATFSIALLAGQVVTKLQQLRAQKAMYGGDKA